MEKKMETTTMGYIGTTRRIHSLTKSHYKGQPGLLELEEVFPRLPGVCARASSAASMHEPITSIEGFWMSLKRIE